ncbi:MAG: MetQ/NlpA family ABC transporter substrate-binding protein [Tissierellia bacterium]|nr:MetQ/NlpA family ABC transporter substrate-binding protein [Tissierellia bacterium]
MKKFTLVLLIVVLSFTILTNCTKKQSEDNLIKIGVSPKPQGEIVELIKDDLKSQGIEIEIVEFTDYITPNLSLADGDIDANFFQHEPYMNDFKEENKLDIISIGGVHIEPMGLYSFKINSIEELKDGSEIAIPNDVTNGFRALLLLEKHDLIKLDPDAGITATAKDIIENPKNLKIKELEAGTLPRVLKDVDGAVINGNHALAANLIPTEDSIILEEKDSPYANIVAVRKGEEDKKKFIELMKALQSEKVRKFIEEEYKGGVIPAF